MEYSRTIAAIRTRQQGEMDTLRQHHSLLQSQFDDLTLECRKARDAVKSDRDSLNKYVKSFTEEQSIKKNLQKKLEAKSQEAVNIQSQLNNLIQENERLKRQVEALSKDNHVVPQPNLFSQQDNISNNKNISKQVTISNDVYLVSVNSNSNKPDLLHEAVKSTPTSSKKQFKSQSIPEGVAPELMVNEDFNVKVDSRVENKAIKIFDNLNADANAKPLTDVENQLNKNPHSPEKSNQALQNGDMETNNLKILPQDEAHREDELFKLDNDVNLDSDISNVVRKNGNDHDFDGNNNLDHAEPAAQIIFDGDDEEPDEYGAHREIVGQEPVNRN